MHRHALRDDQWIRIKDFLPGRDGHVGGTAANNRPFVDAVVFRYRTGVSWRDLPERFGNGVAVHRRYCRWCLSGVFTRVFEIVSVEADAEYMLIDSTSVRAHQHSAGAPKKTVRTKPAADHAVG
jgi:transposase